MLEKSDLFTLRNVFRIPRGSIRDAPNPAFGGKFLHQIPTVAIRKTQVANQQMEFRLSRSFDSGGDRFRDDDVVALCFEKHLQGASCCGMIFNNKESSLRAHDVKSAACQSGTTRVAKLKATKEH